ncbi:MAG: response regulator [Elusimicrobia bacterium]|nr:response regulator [Elusimicrobiota bacterium]
MTILIVEDDPGFRCMMREFLLCGGFNVESAETGAEAVKAALATRPDLVLMDYELGDMSGYDAACSLRYMAATRDIPLVLLSSLGTDPLIISAFGRLPSCRGIICKTTPLDAVLAQVRSALGLETQ